jgi:hypothetical protein
LNLLMQNSLSQPISQRFPAYAPRAALDARALRDSLEQFSPAWMMAFVLLHFPLAMAMYKSSILATMHAALVVLWVGKVIFTARRPEILVFVMAYVTGAEVLWRSSGAKVPYETAKYILILLSVFGLLRFFRGRVIWPPVLYFALLLPSAFLTITSPLMAQGENKTIFKILAFNMAGPLALACGVAFMAHLRLNRAQLLNIFTALLATALGGAMMIAFALRTAKKVQFGRSSISVIREEFGPNQMSAAIGLGVLMALLILILHDRATTRQRLLLAVCLIFMVGASAMTFSRGGLYNTGGAALALLILLMRDPRVMLRVAGVVTVLVLVGNFLVLPYLNTYSKGFLLMRLTNTSLTGRDQIAWTDLIIWKENPVYGVGPGRATDYRLEMGRRNQAHTEATRLVAEHGTLGATAGLLLMLMAWRGVFWTRGPRSQAIAAALVIWSFLYMANAAMRLAAPSFMFALAMALIACDEASPPPAAESVPRSRKRGRLGSASETAVAR